MDRFKALMISKADDGQTGEDGAAGAAGQKVAWTSLGPDDLMAGDVLVRVTHSTVNYKDGLAITGKAPILRHWPMIPGIDLAGVVEASDSPGYEPGDEVVVTGCGLGEAHYGGYAHYARLKSEWLVPLPEGLTLVEAMAIGTAGFTAMLCVLGLEAHHVTPDKGPVLVTGAAGGVGSIAVAVLAKLGFEVHASTGRPEETDYLTGLGAREIVARSDLSEPSERPIGKERWAGAVDTVGSHTLANVLARTKFRAAVAACGLAQGPDLVTTVMPFILRAVTLVGINSVVVPRKERLEAWRRLGLDLDKAKLAAMTTTRPLSDVLALAPEIIEGHVRGRIVLEID